MLKNLRINWQIGGVLLIGAFVLGAAGCEKPEDKTVVTTPAPAPAPAPGTTTVTTTPPVGAPVVTTTPTVPPTNNTNAGAGGATGTESATADAINTAIHTNTQMTGSRITAVVNSAGVARLTGTAQNQQQKALAATTASQTPGVTSVVNKVEIVPTGGAKTVSKPAVTKTKIVVIHDQAPAKSDSGSSGNADNTGTPDSGNAAAPAPNTN